MHRDRLERLAALLDTVPADQFNLRHWDCGTTACAVGWAARDPGFQAEGLRLVGRELGLVPKYDDETGIWAAEAFFGLGWDVTCNLFLSSRYWDGTDTRPGQVAARIRELLAADPAPEPATS